MSAYKKLSGESFDFDFDDIQMNLKAFNSKLKEYHRCTKSQKVSTLQEIEKYHSRLEETFNRPRISSSDTAKLKTLEKNFKELLQAYSKIKINAEQESELGITKIAPKDDIFDGIVEDDSLVVHDVQNLREKQFNKRKEDVEQLHKDLVIVNELFKDSANLVSQQGVMLADSENNLMVAVEQTSKATMELGSANVYQRRAKKKLWIICIIVFVIVAVLVAIVLGVTYK